LSLVLKPIFLFAENFLKYFYNYPLNMKIKIQGQYKFSAWGKSYGKWIESADVSGLTSTAAWSEVYQ